MKVKITKEIKYVVVAQPPDVFLSNTYIKIYIYISYILKIYIYLDEPVKLFKKNSCFPN